MKNLAKHLKRVLPIALLAAALGSSTVLAQPAEGPDASAAVGEEGKYAQRIRAAVKEAINEAIAEELGLTEEQKAQLAEMRKADQATGQELRNSLKTAQKNLKETLSQYDADPATVQSLAAQVKTIQGQMVDHRVASVTKMKEILTPEQFAKIQEKAKERREAFKNKMGNKGRGKFGGGGHGGFGGGFWGSKGPHGEFPQGPEGEYPPESLEPPESPEAE